MVRSRDSLWPVLSAQMWLPPADAWLWACASSVMCFSHEPDTNSTCSSFPRGCHQRLGWWLGHVTSLQGCVKRSRAVFHPALQSELTIPSCWICGFQSWEKCRVVAVLEWLLPYGNSNKNILFLATGPLHSLTIGECEFLCILSFIFWSIPVLIRSPLH